MSSIPFVHIDFNVSSHNQQFTNINTVPTTNRHNINNKNTQNGLFPSATPSYKPPSYVNKPRHIPSRTLGNKKTLKISFSKFHVTHSNRAGSNKIYDIRRSRSYFFELNDLPMDTNEIHLKIYTNDYHVKNSPISYYNTSTMPNDKYRISCMLTHFFHSQRVLPRRIQQKYFNFIRDRLLARKEIIRSRANSDRKRNTSTRTFFNFTYKKYRFYFGIYIPCSHLSTNSGSSLPNNFCVVPTPFVMSRCRRACVMHQHSFFKNDLFQNVRFPNGKSIAIDAKVLVNNKNSHANLLHQRWNNRISKIIYSNRLGISYKSSFHARNVSSVLVHNNTHMYRKRLDNFLIRYSKNNKTKKLQELRFERTCRRIFNKPEHNRWDLPRHQLITAQRYRFLFLKSQYINKPIKHLKYTHGLEHPDYGFVTPYQIDKSKDKKMLISSATFTNKYIPVNVSTVEPYNPIPDMFIPHKYRNIIPKDPIYTSKGDYIIPGSREWFTYMYNLHRSLPTHLTIGLVTQDEYHAQQKSDEKERIKNDDLALKITKHFGTTTSRHLTCSSEITQLIQKSDEYHSNMTKFMNLKKISSDKDHRALIYMELNEFNAYHVVSTYGKSYIPLIELSDNTKELERRPNKRNTTMVHNNFFTTSNDDRYKRRLPPPADTDDSSEAGPSMIEQ